MLYLNTQTITNITLPALIALVVIFAVLFFISGGWYWWQRRKERRNFKNDNFKTTQKVTIRAALQKNKYLILFFVCFFCLIGSILVLVKEVVGYPLF